MVARRGRERLSYGLCVLQILIFLKGASRKPSPSFTAKTSFGAKCPETRFCRETWVSLQSIDGGVEADVEQDQRMDISPHITVRLLQSIIRSLLADSWVETGLNICVHGAK